VKSVVASIVSHGHGETVFPLLHRLATLRPPLRRVWLTFDTPEPRVAAAIAATAWPFELCMRHNLRSQSFARNHNQAFAAEYAHAGHPPECWWILNPDVRWDDLPLHRALVAFEDQSIGLIYPMQIDDGGRVQDYARPLPTPAALLARWGAQLTGRAAVPTTVVDWVNGACLFIRGHVYQTLGGFDEAYRLYVEDVDFCLRVQLAGYRMYFEPSLVVVHAGQRRSRRHWRHAWWHLQGLWRLWRSEPYHRYLRLTLPSRAD
jgi:N-acetylglucosaminyl-diphospho-decaprenol L-rhamnosyltransferase